MRTILIISIGPDAPELLTLQACQALREASPLLVRTQHHGACRWLSSQGIVFQSLDALYEDADSFDAFNEQAAQRIETMADSAQTFAYAVADAYTDETVAALRRRGNALRVVAGVTQAALACGRALSCAVNTAPGLTVIPAVEALHTTLDPSVPLVVTELNSRLLAGEVKLHLLELYPPQMQVLLGDEPIALEALDRQAAYSHLSCVYVPHSPMAERSRYTFGDLLDVMRRLRDPQNGCPWDREQTHETLRQYVIEEAYEVVDAIAQGDMNSIADELGDVLLQVVFHAQVAKEHGEFDISDVTTAICHKMITRHVHIFGDVVCNTPEDVVKSWEAIKKKEKGLRATADVMRDVPGHLPALMRAYKIQGKAHQVGFDWNTAEQALAKVREETDEVLAALDGDGGLEGELGDLLFAAVNTARLAGIEPEVALGGATEKFIRRFSQMEKAIEADGKTFAGMTLSEMDAYWDNVKRQEDTNI